MSNISLTIPPAFRCVSGFVNLFRFIQAPPPGSIIGQIRTVSGSTIPLIQTQPTPLGGTPLSSVDGQFATLCGIFAIRNGQTVLDVRIVNPGAPSPTGTPIPSVNQLLLLLLLLLLSRGGFGTGFGLGGLNTATLQSQLAGMGINISQTQLTNALASLGVSV